MPPPRLFIHCGLHKTGTTALQRFLLSERDALRDLGIVYPQAGRVDELGGGHHNIAWELTRDRRFRRSRGGIEQLLDQIAGIAGDVLLSSEDFETCLSSPELLDPLIRHPRLRGRQAVLVVYLRDQVSYAESLFLQLLSQGNGDECLTTMRTILERQGLPVWEWRFQFDYGHLLRVRQAMPDIGVVFRTYATLTGGSIVPDFIGVLRPNATVLTDESESRRVNSRFPILQSLSLFYANRIRRRMAPAELAAIWLLEQAAGPTAGMRLPQAAHAAFASRFNAGNQALCRSAGLPPDSLLLGVPNTTAPPDACFMDRMFSFETQVAIAALADIVPPDLIPGINGVEAPVEISSAAKAMVAQVIANWRSELMPAAA